MATYTSWEQRQMDIASEASVPVTDYSIHPRIYRATCLEPDASRPHGLCFAGVIVYVNGVHTGQTKCPAHGGDVIDISNAGPAEPKGQP